MAIVTTDHETVRRWTRNQGGKQAAVCRTHGGDDAGIVRLMLPDSPNSKHEGLEEITWDEFFEKFDFRKLALVYDEDSMFGKLVSRDSVEAREDTERRATCKEKAKS